MQRLLVLPRHVVSHMLPLGTSVPCRVVAAVLLAVVSGASMAADDNGPAGPRPVVSGFPPA